MYTTSDDQKSSDALFYKTTGILFYAKPHSAGRVWRLWSPMVTVMNLLKRYPGASSIGHSLCASDAWNLGNDLSGNKSEITYGRIRRKI